MSAADQNKTSPMNLHLYTQRLFLLFSVLLTCTSQAQSVRDNEYEVHYSSMNTSFLSAEVAKAIDVIRAKDRALLNISIRRYNDGGISTTASKAVVSGSRYDLVHRLPLTFKEVVEPGAIYYLAEFPIQNNNEFILLDIEVIPEGIKLK